MLIEKIEALREKPSHVRNMVAFWIALGVTLVILSVWAITIPERFAQIQITATSTEDLGDSIKISESLTPFFTRAKEAFSQLTQKTSTTTEEAPQSGVREDIDFKALLASSTSGQTSATISTTTASSTEATASSTINASSTVPDAGSVN